MDIYPGEEPIPTDLLYAEASKSDGLITMLTEKVDKKFLEANKHLKVISNYAVGYNNIDINAATENGIPIGNTPDVLSDATADLALGLMLAVARKIP